jgi:hypothetical protein
MNDGNRTSALNEIANRLPDEHGRVVLTGTVFTKGVDGPALVTAPALYFFYRLFSYRPTCEIFCTVLDEWMPTEWTPPFFSPYCILLSTLRVIVDEAMDDHKGENRRFYQPLG